MGHAKAKAGANGTVENGAPRGRKRSGPRLWVLPLWLTTVVVLTLLTFRRFLPDLRGKEGVRKPRSDIRLKESVELLYKLGHWHRRRHEDVEALVSFHWAKEVLQHQIGSLHSLAAVEILADIAETMDSQNSLWAMGEKLAVYEECLSIIESFDSGEVDRLLSRVSEFTEPLKNMGLGAISMNDAELELKIWEVSLRFCLATACTDSVRHGELLIRVGVALSKQAEQDSELIMQYYEKAEQILVQLHRQNSHWYAILVHNMGVVFGQQGDRNRELASYEKAVATYRGLKMTHTETFTSILYELASSRTDFGDKEGGREAFLEAERVFVQNPKLQSRMRSHYVGQYGISRRATGDLAGAIHAFEIALQVHEKAQTLRTESGRSAKRNLKEAEDVVASLPKEDRRQITRRIEVLRWPSEPETAEELEAGVYLQRAGR